MSDVRTFEAIDEEDLLEVLRQCQQELRRFLEQAGTPAGKFQSYRDRLLAVCLVQGVAQHFVDTRPDLHADHEVEVTQSEIDEKGYRVNPDGRVTNGVKDIDVIFFFRHDPGVAIPNQRHCRKSSEHDLARLGRRRLDFMKKGVHLDALGLGVDTDPVRLVRFYLAQTDHGRDYLSKKSAVGLFPPSIFGRTLWASRRIAARSSGPAAPRR
jgi:hypothetical protein